MSGRANHTVEGDVDLLPVGEGHTNGASRLVLVVHLSHDEVPRFQGVAPVGGVVRYHRNAAGVSRGSTRSDHGDECRGSHGAKADVRHDGEQPYLADFV